MCAPWASIRGKRPVTLMEFADYVTSGTALVAALGTVVRRLRVQRLAGRDPGARDARAGCDPSVIATVLQHVPDGAVVRYQSGDGSTLTAWKVPPQSAPPRQGKIRPW